MLRSASNVALDVLPHFGLMMNFSEFLKQYEPAEPPLPLCHTNDWGVFLKHYMEDLKIRPYEECDVFKGEKLTYLFYGRPDYKPRHNKPTEKVWQYPVCVILDPKFTHDATRVAPFDTGGFALYKELLHDEAEIDQFVITSDPGAPGRIVAAFFGDNHSYYVNRSKLTQQAHINCIPACSYQAIVRNPTDTEYDSRATAIEVQRSDEIALNAGSVLAVIYPEFFQENKEWVNLLDVWGAWPLPYVGPKIVPADFSLTARTLVYNFLREKAYF